MIWITVGVSIDSTSIDVEIDFDFFIILCQGIAHVIFKLWDSEIELILALWLTELLDQIWTKCTYEGPLVVNHNFVVKILHELWLEICQIESTVIVAGELVSNIQDYFVGVALSGKIERHCLPNLCYLLIRWDKFIKA